MDCRKWFIGGAAAVLIITAGIMFLVPDKRKKLPGLSFVRREMVRNITPTGVLLSTRLVTADTGPDSTGRAGAPGIACFEFSPDSLFRRSRRTAWLPAVPDSDFTISARADRLQPGTRYFYRLIFGTHKKHGRTSQTFTFRTPPLPDTLAP